MIFLIAAGIVLLIICALLFMPAGFTVTYSEELTVTAKLGPVGVVLYPKKSKKTRLSDFSSRKYRKKLALLKQSSDRKGNDEHRRSKSSLDIDRIKAYADILSRTLGSLRVTVEYFFLSIGGSDASAAAVNCATASQAISYATELLSRKTKLSLPRDDKFSVVCSFTDDNTVCRFCIGASSSVIGLILTASKIAAKYTQSSDENR